MTLSKPKKRNYKTKGGSLDAKSRLLLTRKTLEPRCSPSHPEPQTLTRAIVREREDGGWRRRRPEAVDDALVVSEPEPSSTPETVILETLPRATSERERGRKGERATMVATREGR